MAELGHILADLRLANTPRHAIRDPGFPEHPRKAKDRTYVCPSTVAAFRLIMCVVLTCVSTTAHVIAQRSCANQLFGVSV